MRKICFLMVTLLGVGCATAAQMPNDVISGTAGQIRIQGALLSSTCTLRMDSASQSVEFGEVEAKSMTKMGARSAKVPVKLYFSGCLIGAFEQAQGKQRIQSLATSAQGVNVDEFLNGQSAVVVTLVGEPDVTNQKLLKVNGQAAGFGVHFSDQQGHSLNVNEPNRAYVLAHGNHSLLFFADLEATRAAVKAGDFNAIVNVRLNYL